MAEHPLALRIKALIFFRAVFITLLLGSSYLFRIEYFYAHPRAISYYIVTLYLLTIVYALLYNRIASRRAFLYLQVVLDVMAEIVLISITGGIESWFSFTLILTVLSSSILLNKKAGYVIASLGSILYGVLLDLQFYHVMPIPHEAITLEREFLYNIFIHILALYMTAYLAGYLSAGLEKAALKLEEKDSHLRDLERFNLKVIESLPSGLFTTDLQGDVLIFNRAAEEITGVGKERVIGSRIGTALPFLTPPFQEGRREAMLHRATSGERLIGLHLSALKDAGGNETGYICIFQDLTQIKALEAEIKSKEKWAAIGELSANIAHEIRNPLAALRGSVEMLRDANIPEKHRAKLMEIALREMERLDHIVTDFLTYSSPRPLEKRRTDLHLLLEETVGLLSNLGRQRAGIVFRKDYSGELWITADPQKLRQVFWNLGVNAVEAMQDGGEFAVWTADAGDAVSIFFADSGPGIAANDLERIFYPFFTTKEEGTGLGLAIAYRIIEEHKGRISVRSAPGTRTVFEIILVREDEERAG